MNATQKLIGRRLASVRVAAGVRQEDAAATLGLSQPTYSRIEKGTRGLRADELITLADRLGVRAAAIANVDEPLGHAHFAARTNGTSAAMETMLNQLLAYLELDDYLTDRGVPPA